MSRASPRAIIQWLAIPASLVAACFCLGSCSSNADDKLREAARDKNVVMVLLDAAAYHHFGYAGYERETTPVIDALAAESIVFDNAYSPAASTSHAVYSMLTSSYPFLFERTCLETGEIGEIFRVTDETQLMPELLSPCFPHRTGISANVWFGPEFKLDRGFDNFHLVYKNAEVPDSTRTYAGRCLDLLQRDIANWGDERAFVYMHMLEPHAPYTPPEEFARRFDHSAPDSVDGRARAVAEYRYEVPGRRRQEMTRALYDGNLAYADSMVGEMIATLKEAGQWENTIFLVLADHGEAFWQHGIYSHARHIYDEFVRIPLILRIPGLPEQAGRHIEENVSLVDLLPTFMDLLELEIPEDLRGDTLVPLLAGRTEDYEMRKVYLRNTHSNVPEFGLRAGPYKWIYRVYEGSYQLYDLVADPLEKHDLNAAGEVPPGIMQLKEETALWLATETGRVDPVEELDEATREQLHSIGYF